MAYSTIEQQSRDIDVFFSDGSKLIHLATGGGQLPQFLAQNDTQNEEFYSLVLNLDPIYKVITNPELDVILKTQYSLEDYLSSFIEMAARGFYSYDKTVLGDFEDHTFHLVAYPQGGPKAITPIINMPILKINLQLPTANNPFNLFKLLKC